MVTMTPISDLSAAGEVAVVQGQAWTFSHLTPRMRGLFSSWLKGRARQGLLEERRQEILNPSQYREEADALKRQFDAGHYDWGSPLLPDGCGLAVLEAINGHEGKVRIMQLLLVPTHGEVPAEQVVALLKASPEEAEMVALAVRTCLDPNREKPVTKETSPADTYRGSWEEDQAIEAAKKTTKATV